MIIRKLSKKILINLVLNAIAFYAVVSFLDKVTYQGGIKALILASLIIALLNVSIKPIIKVLSLPLIVITAGIFLLIINTGILWLTIKLVNKMSISDIHFQIEGLFTYFIAALVLAIVNWIEHIFIKSK